jgi:hypothetical protein
LCHAKVTKTRTVYAHLFEDDDADAMAALGAMRQRAVGMGNVIRLRVGTKNTGSSGSSSTRTNSSGNFSNSGGSTASKSDI